MRNLNKALQTYRLRIFPFETQHYQIQFASRAGRRDALSYGFSSYLKRCYEDKHGVPACICWESDTPDDNGRLIYPLKVIACRQ